MNEYRIWDEEVWAILKEKIPTHEFDLPVVRNMRWSLGAYQKHNGSEHFFQKDLNRFGQSLFYKDSLNLFEMYNAVLSAEQWQPSLGLADTVTHLKESYAELLVENRSYLALDQSKPSG